jgi:hypothetical protein
VKLGGLEADMLSPTAALAVPIHRACRRARASMETLSHLIGSPCTHFGSTWCASAVEWKLGCEKMAAAA